MPRLCIGTSGNSKQMKHSWLLMVLCMFVSCRSGSVHELRSMEVNGVSIVYEVRGKMDAQPIVLIHGNSGSHNDLSLMAAQLDSAGYLVYAPDCRGQGANTPLDEYHYADMAADIVEMVHKLGIEPYVFGWSDGGNVALMAEISHPGTFKAIITSGANLYPEGIVGIDSTTIERYREENKDASPLFRMMLYEPNITLEQLSTIRCPALIVAGENDLIREEHTRLIAASIPNGQALILPGEDHISHIVNNKKMGEIVISTIKRIETCQQYTIIKKRFP